MRAAVIPAVAVLLAACNSSSTPTTPPAASGPAIVSLAITGLPAPLLFDIPPSVATGQPYTLGAVGTRSDGTQVDVKSVAWTANDPSVLVFSGNTLTPLREGATSITATVGAVSVSREVTVYAPGMARQERAERVVCSSSAPPICAYPACPPVGPFWLFPVHESGTIAIESVRNPGWGSPSNYVVQLSPEGKYIYSWLLLPTRSEYRTATVPGGYMYAFTMSADLGPCGDVSAAWTHPK